MKTETRNMHMKPAQADTQLCPAYISKVADKWQAVTARDMKESNVYSRAKAHSNELPLTVVGYRNTLA
jgi:hypothetical protein